MGVVRKAAVGLVAVSLLAGGAVAAAVGTGAVQAPSVESMSNEWGEVTAETTEIRSRVVVTNPNPIGLQLGGVAFSYTVSMNGVELARGEKEGIDIGTGRNTITLVTRIDNGKIPEWWVTHIDNGEETTLTIDPTVEANLLVTSVSADAPAQRRTVRTDLLSSLNSEEDRAVEALGLTVFEVTETSASWGEATAERTPLDVTAVVRNPNPVPIVFTEVGYAVTMNGVEVAAGATEGRIEIPPGATEPIETAAVVDNSKLDDWWVSHIRNGETTELVVRFYAVVEFEGESVRVPLVETTDTFETDLLGG